MAAELASTAQGLDTVVTQLASESWLGPTSAAMVAAVQPYVSWVTTTAGQAEHAAAQAQSAAAAFETVFASVVPPPLIAANRAELAQAVQTNVLGLNQSVIAQLEAQYAEFWSQNATALYGYASSSAAATKISSFTEAPAIANPAARADLGGHLGHHDSGHLGAELDSGSFDQRAVPDPVADRPVHRQYRDVEISADRDLVPVDRPDHPAHQPGHAGQRLLALRRVLLQH